MSNYQWYIDTADLLYMRLSDSPEYAENIICMECRTNFDEQVQYLGDGRYLAFCSQCDNYEQFSNADVFEFKRQSEHYWMVEKLVRYYHENNLELVTASIQGEWVIDGHHRISSALQLGIGRVLVDNSLEPTLDHYSIWTSHSPAFTH